MRHVTAISLSITFALAACSSGSDSGGPAMDWFKSYAHALCAGEAPCCAAEGQSHDVAACEQFYNYLGGSSLQSAIDKGAKFDQSAANACLDQLKTWFNGCANSAADPPVCGRVVVGTVAPGGSCQTNFDCAAPGGGAPTCELGQGGGSSGKCVEKLPAEAGKPCSADSGATTVYDCTSDPAFYCDYTSNACVKKIDVGQPCDSGGTCVDTATCQPDAQSGALTCQPLAAVGEACGSAGCVKDAYCSSGQCVAKKAVGATCSSTDECAGYCDASTGKCTGGGGGAYLCVSSK